MEQSSCPRLNADFMVSDWLEISWRGSGWFDGWSADKTWAEILNGLIGLSAVSCWVSHKQRDGG